MYSLFSIIHLNVSGEDRMIISKYTERLWGPQYFIKQLSRRIERLFVQKEKFIFI